MTTRLRGINTTSPLDPPEGGSGTLAVWDVDRTLTRRDTLIPFLRSVVGPTQWHTALRRVLTATASHGASRTALKASLLHCCLAGREYDEVAAVAKDFAKTVQQHECRPDALKRWSWHCARGDLMVLASASLELYLRPLAELLGAELVLATGLAVEAGRITGAMSAANCRGVEKARRIRNLIETTGPDSVWVYSDSRSDGPSLDLADVAVRVRPWRKITALDGDGPLLSTTARLGGTR